MSPLRFLFVLELIVALGLFGWPRPAVADEPAFDSAALEFVEREVRPLLVERCFKCHGNVERPKGGLKLVDRAAVLAGGDSGPAAVPGKPAESYLVETIGYRDSVQMPPDGKLSDAQIATLTKWVALGLPWPTAGAPDAATVAKTDAGAQGYQISEEQRQFWSFQPVKVVPPPAVEETAWPVSDIDRYVLARLEQAQLRHAPAADRRTLIRRATFDLTGLPPTPEQVQAFLADTSAEAFGKVVDRLLASPAYGERWGRHWLDVARYTDCGDARDLGTQNPVNLDGVWRYRDWVVEALNRDLPYDRFIVDQIAGDLVEPASPDRLNVAGTIATGFLAVGPWGNGDADKEKMLTDIVDDQINVTSRAFLGLTVACARCHDHKFDPIPTADYYSLAGIFYSTHIIPDVGPKTNGAAMLRVPLLSATELAAREAGKGRLAELKTQVAALREQDYQNQAKGLIGQTARYLMAAWDFQSSEPGGTKQPVDQFAAAHGLEARLLGQWIGYLGLGEPRLLAQSVANAHDIAGLLAWYVAEGVGDPVFQVNPTDIPARYLTFVIPPHSAAMHPSPTGSVAVAWRSPMAGAVRIRGRIADGDPNGGDGVGWAVVRRRGHASENLVSGVIENGGAQDFANLTDLRRLENVEVRPGDALWLVVSPRTGYGFDTTVVELEISEMITDGRSWSLARDVVAAPPDSGHVNPHPDALGNAGVWEFIDLASISDAGRRTEFHGPLARWFEAYDGPGTPAEKRALAEAAATEIERSLLATATAPADESMAKWYAEVTSKNGPFRPADIVTDERLSEEARPRVAEVRDQIASLEKQLAEPIPIANGAQDGGVPQTIYEGFHDARIQVRGSYARLGETVPRRFPRILAGENQTAITEGSGRLELARWLASPGNPLTARVMVNRIWQHHFGEGIVRSASNFGKLGERPTHPELLDYLADRFVQLGWSMKALHREIMLSATYQQSSIGDADAAAKDPDNRLLGRANRWRLESEAVRDHLLAVAGRLDRTLGGPSTRDFAAPRRTIYLMTIRSDRSGFGPLFDSADPLLSVEARITSTVAPQSLFLMNNDFVAAQAGAVADRLLAETVAAPAAGNPPADTESLDRARIERLYELLYARPVTEGEVAVARQLLAARRAVSDERGAWLAYCQVLLCANEFIYID